MKAFDYVCDVQMTIFDFLNTEKCDNLENDIFEYVLLRGTGFKNGHYRVNAIMHGDDKQLMIKQLKEEWGIGGGSLLYKDFDYGFQDNDAKGIRVRLEKGDDEYIFSYDWNKIFNKLKELIENGKYPKPDDHNCPETKEHCNHPVKASIAFALNHRCLHMCCKTCGIKLCGARCWLAER